MDKRCTRRRWQRTAAEGGGRVAGVQVPVLVPTAAVTWRMGRKEGSPPPAELQRLAVATGIEAAVDAGVVSCEVR